MTTPPPRPERCDACGKPDALPTIYRPGGLEYLCPACTSRAALRDSAGAHLHALLWPAVETWAQHWHAAGLKPGDLAALLDLEGGYWHPLGALAREGGAEDAVREMLEPKRD
ncbi:hypothetical protein [Deinococcus aestuarii]|uniref:hypothetical protein n=1 Tax=Deinococcus aestuarii TaxID=2774531 RepID=UPI001C0C260C|nr:hypothetical protein [Deinococcus aestuarii]